MILLNIKEKLQTVASRLLTVINTTDNFLRKILPYFDKKFNIKTVIINLCPMKGATVDQSTCIGCGICAQLCPNVFEMQDDGKSKATNPTADNDCAKSAADSCPVNAIKIEE